MLKIQKLWTGKRDSVNVFWGFLVVQVRILRPIDKVQSKVLQSDEVAKYAALIQNNQLSSDINEFADKLSEMPIDQFQENLIDELDQMDLTSDELSDEEFDAELEELLAAADPEDPDGPLLSPPAAPCSTVSDAPPPPKDAPSSSSAPPPLSVPPTSDAAVAVPSTSDAPPIDTDTTTSSTTLTQPFDEFELQPKSKKRKFLISDYFTKK